MHRNYGTLAVRNEAQKVLWEDELSGQISDGMWENATPHDHWEVWCDARVVVDPDNVGRNFYARKDSYLFNSKELLSIIGDRMLGYVREKVNPDYTEADMIADLKDLRSIIKIERPATAAEQAYTAAERADDTQRRNAAQALRNTQAAEVGQLADELGVDVGYVSTQFVSYKDGLTYAQVLRLLEAIQEQHNKDREEELSSIL